MIWIIFAATATSLGCFAFIIYRRILRRAKGIERGLKMVPLLIQLPPVSAENTAEGTGTDVFREQVSQAQALYDLIAGTATQGLKSDFYGQRHLSLELIAHGGEITYYAAVPIALLSVVQQAILTTYPGAQLQEVEDYNIFNPQSKLPGTMGGELVLKNAAAYPIATYSQMERDPMEAIINSLSSLQPGEGAAVQLLLRPADPKWVKQSEKLANQKRGKQSKNLAVELATATVKAPSSEEAKPKELTPLQESAAQAIENKTKHPGYETLVRVLSSAPEGKRAQAILSNLVTSFALFEAPGSNGFKFVPARDIQGLVTAFIFRFFPPELDNSILNSEELATLFHLPQAVVGSTAAVARQAAKQADAPSNLPHQGLLLGYNQYRDSKKEVWLTPEDRRRHTYIVGQTGTGKTTLLENLMVQDMLAGRGLAFIDPHGDAAEKLLGMVPKSRAEDIIYFDPGNADFPLGLNLFEFNKPEQKDFIVQESINMLYRLYDPGKTGIIGPRYEHWFRNAALTLMADPAGSTFIDVPRIFTDTNFLKQKFANLRDPTVIDFWTKEMAQTSDYHKSEVLGWFVSKFGAFVNNETMRNILGQPKSAFDLREVMDSGKILIVNLSKGRLGELNSMLLGMILVTKFQAAAMSRADSDPESRKDFGLYVDEFQNFTTESFASILSEARKYGLNLIVANQFIGQLSEQIREAVFGNVGTIVGYRVGAEDSETLVKQFAPVFAAGDLVNLPNFNAVVRLMVGGVPSQPFSLASLPPLGNTHPEMAEAVRQLSAAKYGRPRAEIEAKILEGYRPSGAAATPTTPVSPSA